MNRKLIVQLRLLEGFAVTAKETAPALASACATGAQAIVALDKWNHPAKREVLELKRRVAALEKENEKLKEEIRFKNLIKDIAATEG